MPALIENFGDLLVADHYKIFHNQWKIRASKIPVLFNEINSKKPWETFSEIGSFGDWSNFDQNPQLAYQEVNQLYDKKLTYEEWATGYRISQRLYMDDRYGIMNGLPKQMGIAGINMKEKHAAAIFNDAFTTEPSDGNGVELCASDIPYAPGGNTWSNEGTSPFTVTSLGATRVLMMAYKNDKEELGDTEMDMILVPRALEDSALEAIGSNFDPDSANNTINPQHKRYQIVVWDKLTDTNNWFAIDKKVMKDHLHFINRKPPEFNKDKEFDTREAKFSGYMAYIFGWTSNRWLYGHLVS